MMMNKDRNVTLYNKSQKYALSIIIPFYANKNDFYKCLEGIRIQDFNKPFEIIVVESGNDPEIRQKLDSFPNAVLISSPILLNQAKARNTGVENASSDFLVFLDADCIPLSNWLSEACFSLYNYEIVTGAVINLYPFHPVASVDNLLQFPDFQKHRSSKNIDHFSGSNFGITKQLFLEAGGYNEEFILGEDVVFSQSAISKCKDKIFFNRGMIVKHSGRKSFQEFKRHNNAFGFYRGLFLLKIPSFEKKFTNLRLYPLYFAIKRFIYISVRTIQWNPIGTLRIVFYFPLVALGLAAWTKGFRKGLDGSGELNIVVKNSNEK
jgi:glycosyltransferase involved in cell wall biosynthesis